MTKKQKTMAARLSVSAVFLIAGALMEGRTAYAWIPFVISYLSAGYDIRLRQCAIFSMVRYLMRIS